MNGPKMARWHVALSLLFYFVFAPLLTRFTSQEHWIGGLLLAYPLYSVTWRWGRTRGFVAAAIGVGLNLVIWLVAGNGVQVISQFGGGYVVGLFIVEGLASVVIVLIVGNLKRRAEQNSREITHSKDLLRLSELKYINLIELSPGAVCVVENGKVTFCNSHLTDMLGYSREEMIGMPIQSINFEEDWEEATKRYAARAAGKLLPKSICRHVRKGGEVFWVECIGQRIEWEGKPAVLYFSSDITERRRAEEALRASQQIIEGIINAIPVRVFWKDKNLVFLGCNAAFARDAGFDDPKDIIGKDDYQMKWLDQAELYRGYDRQVIEDGCSRLFIEEPQTTPEGNTITLLTSKMPLRNSTGEISGVLGTYMDITERKRAEEALRKSEEKYRISESKYRNLIEVAPEAISVVENAKVIFFNDRLLGMLGYTHDEMLGMPLQSFIYGEDLENAMEVYSARVEGQLLPKSTLRNVTKDGKILWVETVGQRIDWEGRPAVLYFSADVTERKALEEQFVQVQKMEAIGRLAGGIAHDFNNMLHVILGFCSMMKGYPEDRNAILNDLGVIEDSATRAASLTQQLLAFSRKQIVQPKVIDVVELVHQSEKMLGRVLGEDVALAVVSPEEDCYVRADAAQIQQVVMNLALNARDSMPNGGRITISINSVALLEAKGHEIPIGDYVRLTVSDTGKGMDASTIDHIFEPFYTTKGLGKGTGLGLSIVYGIVKQCDGHIQVESEIGAGSTFTIHLPRIFERTDISKAREEEESQHGSASILLVEDEAMVRGLVKKMLESHGYTVTEAESGEEAIKVCRAHGEGFDLLITDMILTGMRGTEVSGSVRQFFPKVHVIYMSGYIDISDTPKLDSFPILQKPFSSAELLVLVKKTLAVEPHSSTGSI